MAEQGLIPVITLPIDVSDILDGLNKAKRTPRPLDEPSLEWSQLHREITNGQRSAFILSGAPHACRAQVLALRLACRLGKPQPAGDRAPRERIQQACEDFCNLFEPSCWVAFYWNKRLNRTVFLHQKDLKFPECMHGISVELPRLVLFDDHWHDPKELSRSQPAGFRKREGVQLGWGMPVRWAFGRLAIFLNWREDDCQPIDDSESSAFSGKASRIQSRRPRRGPAEEPRDACVAARYLGGWLSTAALEVGEPQAGFLPRPYETIGSLRTILECRGNDSLGEALASFIKGKVVEDKYAPRAAVHWTNLDEVGGESATELYLNHGNKKDPKRIDTDGEELQKEGTVAAQAATWRAPILIRDLQSLPEDHLFPFLDVSPADYDGLTRALMAVLMKNHNDGVRAVLTIAADKDGVLKESSLHCAQLVLAAVSRLMDLPNDGDYRRFVQEWILNPKDPLQFRDKNRRHPKSAGPESIDIDWLFRILGTRAVRELHVDLACAHTYDSDAAVFRPRGITISDDFREKFSIRHYGYEPGRGRGFGPPGATEDALTGHLLPRSRGLTWQVFTQQRTLCLWPAKHLEESLPGPLTKRYFNTMIGMPLKSEAGAQPDGVLWLRWMELPPEVLLKKLKQDVYHKARSASVTLKTTEQETLKQVHIEQVKPIQTDIEEAVADAVQQELDPLLPLIAALHSLFNCCRRT